MSPLCSPLGHSMDYPPSLPQPLAVPCAAATLKFRKADGGVLLLLWPPVPVQATLCWSHVGLGQPAEEKSPSPGFHTLVPSISEHWCPVLSAPCSVRICRNGMEGGRGARDGGDVCMCIADSPPCVAETQGYRAVILPDCIFALYWLW